MKLKIDYKGIIYDAIIHSDHKVIIVMDDEELILDQCINCGIWLSEDDEMYGDGYCTNCCKYDEEKDEYVKIEESNNNKNPYYKVTIVTWDAFYGGEDKEVHNRVKDLSEFANRILIEEKNTNNGNIVDSRPYLEVEKLSDEEFEETGGEDD